MTDADLPAFNAIIVEVLQVDAAAVTLEARFGDDLEADSLDLVALVGASDHGASKSLYGKDPDGNEFEVMWAVPRAVWEQMDHATTQHLDLDAELARWSDVSG